MPWKDAHTHVLTHGLHYASCVFEGQRIYGGTIYKLKEHTDRLFMSAETLGMKIPYTARTDQSGLHRGCQGTGHRRRLYPSAWCSVARK